MLIMSKCDFATVWDIPSKKMQCLLEIPCLGIFGNNFSFTRDGKSIEFLMNGFLASSAYATIARKELTTTTYNDFHIVTMDAKTGKMLKSQNIDGYYMCKVPGTPDLITAQYDLSLHKKNLDNGKTYAAFYGEDSETYIVRTEDGYYQSTANAPRYLHFVDKELNVFKLGATDLQYNRPDLVQRTLNNTDSGFIKMLENAREKRLKREGVKPDLFQTGKKVNGPDIYLPGMVQKTVQQEEWYLLRIRAIDSVFKISKLEVHINGIPIFGSNGHMIANDRIFLDTAIYIILNPGRNIIEISAVNNLGIKSISKQISVYYQPENDQKPAGKTYFIGIGIDKFQDDQYNLRYSVKDIRDLAGALKRRISEIEIDTIFNQKVTKENILSLKSKLLKTSIHDKVIVAYSGHGILNYELDYYLSTFNIDFNKPEGKGISYEDFESLIDSIQARKKIMFIDACHSGEIDKEGGLTINNSGKIADSVKGVKPLYPVRNNNSGQTSFELMRNMFSYSGKSPGGFILAAAGGSEFALEKTDIQNGVFTYSILDFIKNYHKDKTVNALYNYVSQKVNILSGGTQQPVSRTGSPILDWNIF